MEGQGYHEPVLAEAVIRFLSSAPAGLILDGTLGGGGHAAALLEALPEARLLGVDRDPEALAYAAVRLEALGERFRTLHAPFDRATDDREVRASGLAGVLLDLGVSSHQLDDARRGFTLRPGAPLDMRMDPGAPGTAADLIRGADTASLTTHLKAGDAPRPGALARRIVDRRGRRPVETSDDLVGVLESVLGRAASHNEKARTFQALRLAVNDELGSLRRALPGMREALLPGGVLVVIAYHSLEDRVVKRAFQEWSDPSHGLPPRLPVRDAQLRALGETLTRKPVRPDAEEVARNPRAKPARLRAWRRGP